MRAPNVVNSVEFARKRGAMRGEIAVDSLQRLRGALFDSSGQVSYVLSGFVNDQGEPCLQLEVRATLMLACQRCLAAMPFQASARRIFVLTSADDEAVDIADEDDEVEHIPADPKLDVLALAEDELILGLPIAPVHDDRECRAQPVLASQNAAVLPFSKLAALKQPKI